MPKQSKMTRKRKAPGEGVWKKIEVGLTDRNGKEEDNHYDSSSLKKHAERDLEAEPGEDMGFFLGLEVIDGRDYHVEDRNGSRILVVNRDGSVRDGTVGGVVSQTSHTEDASLEGKNKKRKPNSTKNFQESIPKDEPPKQNTKQKKKKSQKKTGKPAGHPDTEKTVESIEKDAANCVIDESQIQEIQSAWMSQTGGVAFHREICKSLLRQNFWTPTPIQAACLPAAILGRRNLVGSAPTGSGKTLAFLLPIFQSILEAEDREKNELDSPNRALKALIVAPSRELARQLSAECEKIAPRRVVLVVGGLAHAKQKRLLDRRPPILVGTPGRVWELISSTEYEHLNDLSQIKYLVIDEADRMIQLGNFPQLTQILDAVHRANPMSDGEDEDEEENLENTETESIDRMLGLPGIPGESRVKMLNDDILKQVEAARQGTPAVAMEHSDDETEEYDEGSDALEASDNELVLPSLPPVNRQTFVFSATLSLPAVTATGATKHKRHDSTLGGAVSEILDEAHAKGKTKVVDLSTNTKVKEHSKAPGKKDKQSNKIRASSGTSKFQLPPGLALHQVKCTQKHKDSYLYAYLMTTKEGNLGPCLVFCNSIAAVRRVGKTLEMLGLDVMILHAKMQQRARFKAVEKLQKGRNRTVVVATDVAARGLDILSVRSVVHYDVARTVDTFVHRAGRTARGVGDYANGHSLSLVSPAEDKTQSAIQNSLKTKLDTLPFDGRLLRESQERVNLATKVIGMSEIESHAKNNNAWFRKQASEAGLEVDDDLFVEGFGESKREQAKLKDAVKAKERLAKLLAEPIRTQRHGKFLSTNSAAQIAINQG